MKNLAAGGVGGKSTGWLRHKVSSWPMKPVGQWPPQFGIPEDQWVEAFPPTWPRSLWNSWSKGRKAGRAQERSKITAINSSVLNSAQLHRRIDACATNRHPQLQSLPEQEGPRSAGKCKSLPLQNKIDQLVCSLVRLGIHCPFFIHGWPTITNYGRYIYIYALIDLIVMIFRDPGSPSEKGNGTKMHQAFQRWLDTPFFHHFLTIWLHS